MGIFDKLRNEFIDIIEWVDEGKDTIVWKFPRYNNEIKMNAKLTVRESQVAVFMNEGKIADVFLPGMYTLSTQNMPIMTTLRGWKYGFESPFKADIFFVSMRQFTNQRWGTKNPIMLRDAEFGPVRLRAFGTYAFRVQDATIFLKEIAATNPEFTTEEINEQLRNIAVTRGMDAIAEARIPVLDIASKFDEVSLIITDKIRPEFNEIGLDLTKFLVENVSLPEEVEAILDKRSGMGIVGDLGAFAKYQAANAMEKAAENSGGGGIMGAGLGAGIGVGMMGQMGNIFQSNKFDGNNTPAQQSGQTPPPLPGALQYFFAINGKQEGPFNVDQITEMIANGKIDKLTLAWNSGMANWAAAAGINDLQALFSNNTPPPIPTV